MTVFTILLGGDLAPTERLARQVAGTRVIAADSGMRHASALGIVPELWVGDFDSSDEAMRGRHAAVERAVFPPEKDKTDGELAIDIALERGASALLLAGAFGGLRADHAFLHLALAIRMAEAGIPARLSSGAQEGLPILPGAHDYDFEEGSAFSILGFSALRGLTVAGAKWPLDKVVVPFGSSLTLSNEVSDWPLRVSLREGRALLLVHFDAT
jgi:thiamine pyrophosphokinase